MHRSPTVWFVSELFWPEETSTGYFLTRIAEDAARDRTVRVVCSQPTYSARGRTAPRRERLRGMDVFRVRSTRLDKDVLFFRVLNLLTFGFATFIFLLRRLRAGEIVVAVTNPPLVPYLVRLAAWFRGARFILLVHDVYPEVLVATGIARAGDWRVRLLDRASRRLYLGADRVVVLGRDMASLVAAKLPASAIPPVIIPNWGDVELNRPDHAAGRRVRAALGLGDRFVVQYMGNMGRTHDLASVLDAAELLRNDESIHFLLMGWGARRRWVEDQVAARALANVTVRDPCAEAEICGYLNAADVAVISFLPGMAGVSVPSRLYNVMAAGRAVLAVADEDSELALVIREEGTGWLARPQAPDELAALIRHLASHRGQVGEAGERARDVAIQRYSRAPVSAAWARLLDDPSFASKAPVHSRVAASPSVGNATPGR